MRHVTMLPCHRLGQVGSDPSSFSWSLPRVGVWTHPLLALYKLGTVHQLPLPHTKLLALQWLSEYIGLNFSNGEVHYFHLPHINLVLQKTFH